MAFNDSQELRRVAQVLSECSGEQIISLLRQSHVVGVNRLGDKVYRIDYRNSDDGDDDRDYDD